MQFGVHHSTLISKVFFIMSASVFISFIVCMMLVCHSARNDQFDQLDAIVILGAGLDGDKPRAVLQERLNASLYYLYESEAIPVVVSGGQGADETISEAEAMRRFLIDAGIAAERIIIEDQSTSTKENLANSASLLHALLKAEKPKVGIVTSGFHLFRAKQLATKYGMAPFGIAARTPTILLPRYLLREYMAIINDLVLPSIVRVFGAQK